MRSHRLTTVPILLVAAGGLVVGLAMPAAGHEARRLINGSLIKKHSIVGDRLKNNTVTGAQIKESTLHAVPRAKLATKLPAMRWHQLALVNGWTVATETPGTRPPAYAVDAEGIVHLRGAIVGGSQETAAFALPASVVPASARRYLTDAVGSAVVPGALDIQDGQGIPLDGSGDVGDAIDLTSLEGVTFGSG